MPSTDHHDIRGQLTRDMPGYRQAALSPLIDTLERRYGEWTRQRAQTLDEYALETFLAYQVEDYLERIERLHETYGEFLRRYGNAVDVAERQEHILNLCRDFGANRRNLRRDRQAFGRWFGVDAMGDRFRRRLAGLERDLAEILKWMGLITQRLIREKPEAEIDWQRLELENVVTRLLPYGGDERVRVAAFSALARALETLPAKMGEAAVTAQTLRYIYRSALDHRQDLWIQRAAIRLLRSLSPESFQKVLQERLPDVPADGDDLFFRSYAVELLTEELPEMPALLPMLAGLTADPSPTVRQRLAAGLTHAPIAEAIEIASILALKDGEPCVRAAALLAVPGLLQRNELLQPMIGLLKTLMEKENDPFVLRVALRVTVEASAELDSEQGRHWLEQLRPVVEKLRLVAKATAVRRWSGQACEHIWLLSDRDAGALHKALGDHLQGLRAGRRRRLPNSLARHDGGLLLRVLSLLAQDDYGYSLERGISGLHVRRGERLGFRLWRFLHEWRNPSPDKRQAHRHTVGRVFYGLNRAPSAILAELAETKVPGEPLFLGDEQGWRPYLPLLDEVISSLDQGWPTRPYQIVTPEGVTELWPPRTPWGRLWTRMRLSWRFPHYAALRNWQPGEAGEADAYAQALLRLGFSMRFTGHSSSTGESLSDPRVARFFPAFLPWPAQMDIGALWQDLTDYFVSVYENSLLHLGLFITVASGYFFGRHIYLNQQLRRARNSLALVIGGWGTRGKSGTERIKAALFNALGYSLVSKTTGCEAMFIVSPPNGRLREMFLFRPYEKATIWEQFNLVRLAGRLNSEVFLWECMGLTPAFIHILQHHWMRDDIATITNTYPDHEDLQGPAGYDIPTVMTRFVPDRSILVTSEEQMLPILRDAARRNRTELHTVGWLEAGMLAPDILARFPYEEHPYNIALVMGMARELRIGRDFALKEMADRVVPDLGVLKAYPTSWVAGRRLRYVMGMSANERFGTLNNWTRMGFDRMQREQHPDLWVAAVVNNRADRIPRSRVFADIIATELSVDRYLLIGGNIQGLLGYIREAWDASAERLALWTDTEGSDPVQRLEEMAQNLRIAVDEEALTGRLAAALSGLGLGGLGLEKDWAAPDQLAAQLAERDHAEALMAFYRHDLQAHRDYRAFSKRVAEGGDPEELQREWLALAWSWFEYKLVPLHDYHASGNQVVEALAAACQPGLMCQVMGLQNIKGTGLDFVYRWQAWESCHAYCRQALSGPPRQAREAVSSLAQFAEFGPLCGAMVSETVEQVARLRWAQREEVQAELTLTLSHLQQALAGENAATEDGGRGNGRWRWLLEAVEAFFDSGDAVKRRKQADRIYRDLTSERISQDRAAQELQKLNKRQKGGWLLKG